MNKAAMAIWKHRGRDHSDCGDWCPSHSGDMDRANRNSLPNFVLKAIKPVFEAFCLQVLPSQSKKLDSAWRISHQVRSIVY